MSPTAVPQDTPATPPPDLGRRSDPWTDLALTLPIFVIYHLGVIFLPVRNAADPVTSELRTLAKHSLLTYTALTLAIGAVFVAVLFTMGRRQALEPKRFLYVGIEGTLYAVLMRFAGSYVVGSLRLAGGGGGGGEDSVFSSVVMALGAGFYEEVCFRVGLFGVGAIILRKMLGTGFKGYAAIVCWGIVEAVIFSAWHYNGELGDQWDAGSFVFRAVCGLVLTGIFAFRGFAPAVWTHALYDLWVMILG
ncbi:CAAX amino terminal protease family protein [Minicystis rosea]|nr:CAAX amino terminal protease family protein [Minicystis rosea]